MSMIYSDYNRDRIGWFFGVSGRQLALLAASALPVIISLQDGAWMAALLFSAMWLLVLVITVVPVRGRSATGWFLASTAFAIGGFARWTRWRSKASTGQIENLTEADLPGVLQVWRFTTGRRRGRNCCGLRSSKTMPQKAGRSPRR